MYLHDLVARPLHRGRRGAAIQITAEGELVPEVQQGERGVSEGRGEKFFLPEFLIGAPNP